MISNKLQDKLRDPEYRKAFVAAQINIGIPFQIRALLKGRGKTQDWLAKQTGMLQPRISGLLTPGKTRPNIETLRRIAEAFDCGLIVRFAPFSELAHWSETFDPESFQIPSFDAELPQEHAAAADRPIIGWSIGVAGWPPAAQIPMLNNPLAAQSRALEQSQRAVANFFASQGCTPFSTACRFVSQSLAKAGRPEDTWTSPAIEPQVAEPQITTAENNVVEINVRPRTYHEFKRGRKNPSGRRRKIA
jgi:transcriptional regulator with XRE-family HTH domain